MLNLFTHIKGKPHPAQRRMASPAPHGTGKAPRTPSRPGTAPQARQRGTLRSCATPCARRRATAGMGASRAARRSQQEQSTTPRKSAVSQQKSRLFGLPTAGQTLCCPASKVKRLQEAASPPTPQLQREWKAAAFPAGHVWRGSFLAALSREELSTMSVTAFIHPAFQQAGLRLSFCSAR